MPRGGKKPTGVEATWWSERYSGRYMAGVQNSRSQGLYAVRRVTAVIWPSSGTNILTTSHIFVKFD